MIEYQTASQRVSESSMQKTLDVVPQVFVVDDNRDAAHTMARLLNLLGIPTQEVHSGADALHLFQTQPPPTLIFLDLSMPGMDGIETAQRIRQLEGGADVVLIALTGLGQEQDIVRTQKSGFSAHLVKPVNLQLLERTLSQYLGYQPLPAKCTSPK